jgi:hypothetical protein
MTSAAAQPVGRTAISSLRETWRKISRFSMADKEYDIERKPGAEEPTEGMFFLLDPFLAPFKHSFFGKNRHFLDRIASFFNISQGDR